LKSPAAAACAGCVIAIDVGSANVSLPAPAKIRMLALVRGVVGRSGMPSPLRSTTAIDIGRVPAVIVTPSLSSHDANAGRGMRIMKTMTTNEKRRGIQARRTFTAR
jgi:hypothetical protein